VQVVLRVAADQFLVLGEGYVAFDDAGAHARGGFVGFLRVLGELHRRAAVADREIARAERAVGALLQRALERAVLHVLDEEERARAELDGVCGADGSARIVAITRMRSSAQAGAAATISMRRSGGLPGSKGGEHRDSCGIDGNDRRSRRCHRIPGICQQNDASREPWCP